SSRVFGGAGRLMSSTIQWLNSIRDSIRIGY
ncbi:MAG: hypothetical protein ACI9UU_002877, partial [Candidatus Azotimanducaceae bacterium]